MSDLTGRPGACFHGDIALIEADKDIVGFQKRPAETRRITAVHVNIDWTLIEL
jgi:hypothetical protein